MLSNDFAPRFQHVQPGLSAYDDSSREASEYLNGVIRQLSLSPHLYSTKSTARELQKAADYLAQIKLENDLFKGSSSKWQERYTQRELVTQKQALLRLKEKFTDPGGQFLARYQANMDIGPLYCHTGECTTKELAKRNDQDDGVGWTDTSLRAAHAWAVQELRALNEELAPLAEASKKRVEQYLDALNVTDRYSGYRSNLGYMSKQKPDAVQAVKNVTDSNIRPPMAPRWHLGLDWSRAEAVGTQDFMLPDESLDCQVSQRKSIERYANQENYSKLNTIDPYYPGHSEYQDKYMMPSLVENSVSANLPPATHRTTFEQPPGIRGRGSLIAFDSAQLSNKGYGINPVPNYLNEWDREKLSDKTEYHISESKLRFKWPET